MVGCAIIFDLTQRSFGFISYRLRFLRIKVIHITCLTSACFEVMMVYLSLQLLQIPCAEC